MVISQMARGIYDGLARGWNTWDVRSVAAHVYLPGRLRLHVSFVIPARSGYTEDSLWDHVENFGEHSDDGRYTSVDIAYLEGRWRIETSARGEELLVRVTPLCARAGALYRPRSLGDLGRTREHFIRGRRIHCREKGGKGISNPLP